MSENLTAFRQILAKVGKQNQDKREQEQPFCPYSQINLVYPCLSRSIKPIPTLLKQMGSLSSSFQELPLLLDEFGCFSQ